MHDSSGTPRSRLEIQSCESKFLAPYAQRSFDSRGRRFEDPSQDWRTPFQRDRDRVIHSRAFRRLEYKTQVFLNGSGDHLRTRLTHTIEVAAIARNFARALRLNEDLTETIALAHDLGHSPFGHSGEHTLNELMQGEGGFEHNIQSLRIVETLETKYPNHPGLNLSWEVREGLLKHRPDRNHPNWTDEFSTANPSLEAQAANLADEITYYSHDLDDGLEAGLLDESHLAANSPLWDRITSGIPENVLGEMATEHRRYYAIRCLLDYLVKDIVQHSLELIESSGITSSDEARQWPERLIRPTPSTTHELSRLRKYLFQNLYLNDEVRSPNERATSMLRDLFQFYQFRPQELGEGSRSRLSQYNLKRVVCDYLAGMTDGFALKAYAEHLGRQPLLPFGSGIAADN
ncbi:MAG: deoxyguanosinetriphosphate triphosphohydrolase [Verrucomicrobia bacterium]|nr:deoxyguanosinetriphosphate triphosphohydrolase [Verrucomicrobiota bacterium]